MRFSVLCLAMLAMACEEPAASAPSSPTPEAAEPGLVLVREDPTDAPIAGLSDALAVRFEEGDARFELPFRDSQGLGPLYVHRSCGTCHEDDARGPGAVRRLAYLGDGAIEAALPFGDVVRTRMAAGAHTAIEAPARDDVREERRLGPAVFGRGYLEAIGDETLLAFEAAQATRDDGVSGRAHRVPRASAIPLPADAPALGRFGLKARLATLDEFVADALLGDMGLTTPRRPEEPPNPDGLTDDEREGVDVSLEELGVIVDYVRLLAIPRRELPDGDGAALFSEARCDACHVPTARTRADHPVELLRDVEAAIYTDLLLHDMGEGLADGVPEHDASGREWRTAPLIGVRHLRALLHDGRAATVREAIALHASEGSEANDSIARFDALSTEAQDRLVRFVEAL